MTEAEKRLILSRPVDESFESFKAWIARMYEAMTGKPAEEMDEEELRRGWEAFRSEAAKPKRPRKQPNRRGPAEAADKSAG